MFKCGDVVCRQRTVPALECQLWIAPSAQASSERCQIAAQCATNPTLHFSTTPEPRNMRYQEVDDNDDEEEEGEDYEYGNGRGRRER
eukprot:scaffold9651_cov72-Cyclotella_meneghiniana.AAC.1